MAKPTRLTQEMIDTYMVRGYWDETSIAKILRLNATNYPQSEAIVDGQTRLTWSALDRITDALALGLLEKGIERDQALVAQVPTPSTTLLILLACHKAGIICCFPPLTFRQNEIRHVLKTLNAVAVVTPLKYRNTDYFGMVKEIAADLPQLRLFIVTADEVPQGAIPFRHLLETPIGDKDPEKTLASRTFGPFEVSIISLTSGTTGLPKCIEHTGASSKAGGWGVVERGKMTQKDILGDIAPLSGGPGLQNWWAGFQVGAKICLLERFSPEGALELIEREGVTYLAAIPTQLIKILKDADLGRYDLTSLRVVRTGAAAFDAALARETEEKMNCKVLIAGGSQETYSFGQTGVDDPPEKRLYTLGKPFPGNEVKIASGDGKELPQGEVGELFVRGATTSSGYFADPDTTVEAWCELGKGGWYRTGDLAKLDEQGYLVMVGRKREVIIRGGQNIFPKEIEDLLLTHPHVTQAVVIGIPDQVMGERACACVTLVKRQAFTFEEMISFLKEKGLAIHKLPERLEVVEEFPQLVDGQKVDKISLKKMILDKITPSPTTSPSRGRIAIGHPPPTPAGDPE
ncbi:MAG: AMP-binding protein [Desulfobacteraceae bacterium]|jgi:non-ribosomal peptide synthetase component E (peptide arylation enzyme)